MENLEGQVAFITGGASGIGLGIARACADAGVKIALADVDDDALTAAANELSTMTEVQAHRLDVADREAYGSVATEVRRGLGEVSLLFNNAGVADSTSPSDMSHAVYAWMRGVNIDGVYNGLERFVPTMTARGQGHIVNTASEQGLVPGGSGFVYSMTRFAVVGLSEALRKELAPLGVGVSVLCPGPVATSIVENTMSLRPGDVPAHSAQVKESNEATHARLLAYGRNPNNVGKLVLDAIRHNRPYVFTQSANRQAIEQRTVTIVVAMEDDQAYLDALAAAEQ